MRKNGFSIKKFLWAGLLSAALLCAFFLNSAVSTKAIQTPSGYGGEEEEEEVYREDVVYEQKNIYHWSRVYSFSQVEKYVGSSVRVMILWKGDNSQIYRTYGNTSSKGENVTSDAYIQYEADEFYTLNAEDCWQMMPTGKYGDHGTYLFKMKSADGNYWLDEQGNSNDILKFSRSADTFGFSVGDSSKGSSNYCHYTKNGFSMFLRDKDGSDAEWEIHNDTIKVDTDSDYDYDQYILYINDYTLDNAQMGSHTLASGLTLQIKGDVILRDGAVLTIEPGAVLSIEGNFFNNGTIENYGTVVVNENSTITFIDPDKPDTAGTINNYGSEYMCNLAVKGGEMCGEGNFIIMPGAKVLLPGFTEESIWAWITGGISAEFVLSGGANLVNFGLLAVPGTISLSNSSIRIEEGGYIVSHCKYTKNLGNIRAVTAEDLISKSATYGVKSTGVKNYMYGAKSVVRNYGTWYGYSEASGTGSVSLITDKSK